MMNSGDWMVTSVGSQDSLELGDELLKSSTFARHERQGTRPTKGLCACLHLFHLVHREPQRLLEQHA